MSSPTVAEWQEGAGYVPGTPLTRVLYPCALESVAWAGTCDGKPGWWWCVARDNRVIAGGWGLGSAWARNKDIAAAVFRIERGHAVSSDYIITFTTAPDERFPGRTLLIGEVAGARRYASFMHRRDAAEAAIRDAFEEAFAKVDRDLATREVRR